MNKRKSPLKVALHAMDERSSKLMKMYLQGPCQGVAVVVSDKEAECDIFDMDAANAGKQLDARIALKTAKPIIALSLQEGKQKNVLYVKKPVKLDDLLANIEKARVLIETKASSRPEKPEPTTPAKSDGGNLRAAVPPQKNAANLSKNQEATVQPAPKKQVNVRPAEETDEQKKTSKHQAAMQLTEKNFGSFIGNVPGVDVNDPKQFDKAMYNPKHYLQGYVESAFKVSEAKGQIRQLNIGWNPLILFPHSHEIWFDVDDKQLRSFAGLALNNNLDIKITLTPLDPNSSALVRALDKFHAMDAFLWKLACWASKGRYPESLDIYAPVYLKRWPNFTRMLVTPHALRISALLIQGPRTLTNVAQVLNIKPQYVFVFISAAFALGMVGQAQKNVDQTLPPPDIQPNKKKGLLSRIIQKLRGN
ncbi:MAG: hypothetical protein NTV43_06665 [Methylococcales bacterium]|nr:hypothetical protein [Methylococcales bacterium]